VRPIVCSVKLRVAMLALLLTVVVGVGNSQATVSNVVLTVGESSPYEHLSGSTLYYAPAGSNTGSFTVTAAASTTSSITSVDFPSIPGMSGGGTIAAPGPYQATFGWTASTTASGPYNVTVHDSDPSSAFATFTVTADTTGPAGQTVALSGGPNYSALSVPLLLSGGTDSGAGVDTAAPGAVERASATLTGGTCGTFGSWTPVTLAAGSDATVVSGNCYRYQYKSADLVGNLSAAWSPASADAKVNAFGPVVTDTAPTEVSGAGDQFWNSATDTLYFRPTATGSFTLNATASDSASGIAQVAFPDVSAVAGWSGSTGGVDTSSPYSSPADYTWTAGAAAPGSKPVTATNGTGVTATDTIALAADAAAPTGQAVSLTGGPWFSTSVPLALVPGADAGAGVDLTRAVVERASGTLTNGVCGTFGTFAAATLSAGADPNVVSGNCYRYQYKATDNVGNVSGPSAPSADAKIDKTAPSIPSLLFTSFSNTAATGNVVYVRPGGRGSFTVTAAASDPESGIASYSFPTVPGFTAVGSGPRRTYTSTNVGTGASGALQVTATNNAGVNSGVMSFSLLPDSTPPALGVRCNGAPCRTQPYAKTVILTFPASDVGGSGVSTVRWTRDGSEPKIDRGFEYSGGIPVQGVTRLKVRAFDKAGNPSALVSLTVRSLANRLLVGAPTAVVVKARAKYVQATISSTRRALVSATMTGTGLKKPLHWNFVLASGTSIVKLRLPATLKRPGSYRVVWTLKADTRRAQRTTRVTLRR
jgi:hypothetical protein